MNRDEKKQATRRSLLAAAQRLFRAVGYEQVSTRDISAAAGVSTGTLFAHFKDKNELTKALFLQELDEQLMQHRVSLAATDAGLAYFAQHAKLLYNYYDQDRALSVALLQHALFEQDYFATQMTDFVSTVADRLVAEWPQGTAAQRTVMAQAWMGFYFQQLFQGLSSNTPTAQWHAQLMQQCEVLLELLP
ncbi:MAG: TetR family transcriptional regulator [Natronospirillum sp.]